MVDKGRNFCKLQATLGLSLDRGPAWPHTCWARWALAPKVCAGEVGLLGAVHVQPRHKGG